jgi:hypothetical protein
MLSTISLIPNSVREAFAVQDLPARAAAVSEDTLRNVFGGCLGKPCSLGTGGQCCSGFKCTWFNLKSGRSTRCGRM